MEMGGKEGEVVDRGRESGGIDGGEEGSGEGIRRGVVCRRLHPQYTEVLALCSRKLHAVAVE